MHTGKILPDAETRSPMEMTSEMTAATSVSMENMPATTSKPICPIS